MELLDRLRSLWDERFPMYIDTALNLNELYESK